MNKVSLLTVGRKLNDDTLKVLSIYDLEPSGLIVSAYDQHTSKEYTLPISEYELAQADFDRSQASLKKLLETIELVQFDDEMILQSKNEHLKRKKERVVGDKILSKIKSPMNGVGSSSMHDVLNEALVDLCKVKPVGLDAVRLLGGIILQKNPNKPTVNESDPS